jgi:hypothetical protein
VWNFADYGKWVVVGQDHAIETIQKVLIANSKLADRGNPRGKEYWHLSSLWDPLV